MIYAYKGHCSQPQGWERICRLAEYEANPHFYCPECGTPLERHYTPLQLHTKGFDAFRSPVDGTVISSQKGLMEHNRRNNVVQLHEGYDEKAVQGFTKKDWTPPSDTADLKADMAVAVEKLEQGYKPTPETEMIPE